MQEAGGKKQKAGGRSERKCLEEPAETDEGFELMLPCSFFGLSEVLERLLAVGANIGDPVFPGIRPAGTRPLLLRR